MKNLLFAFAFFTFYSLQGQNSKVKGTVLDPNNAGVPFASVIISSAIDSILVKAGTTDVNGGFTLNGLENGTYYLSVSFVGFNRFDSEKFEIKGNDYILNPIFLNSQNIQLEEVNIKAERSLVEVHADKTVFNVNNAGGTAGLSGFELLRRSPGVIVDNNDNIIVEGKSGVQVWIDGKPSILSGADLVQYLKSIQASDMEAIEIITQPSSKYDAEGSAGIINIRLKRNRSYGMNGNVSAGTAYGEYWKWNSSLSLNNRTRKTNSYFTYSNRFNKTFNDLNFRRSLLDNLFDSEARTIKDNDSHNFKGGLDIFVSPNSTVGFMATGNLSEVIDATSSRMKIGPIGSEVIEAVLKATSTSVGDSENLYLNANYKFEDTLGFSLNVDLDWGNYKSERVNDQPNTYFNGSEDSILFQTNYQMVTPLEISITSAKIDHEQKLGKGTFSSGLKAVEVKTENTFDFYEELDGILEFQDEQSNHFDYTEQVLAAYFNYAYSREKFSYQIGLRAENTHSLGELTSAQMTEDDRVERDYLDWFPSAGATYKYHPKNTMALNYSRRINRPDYESLNPFEYRLNELGFQKGNPFLAPSYTQNIKLTNSHNYRLNISASYSYIQDYSAQIIDTLDAQVTFLQQRTVANEEIWNFNISYPFEVNKWWSVFANATFYNTSYTATDDKFVALSRSTFNFYGQNTFKIPGNWTLELSGWFNSPSIWGGTFETGSVGSVDVSVQKKLFNDQLSLSLSGSDIFLTTPWTGIGNFGALDLDADGRWESRQVRFNLQYNFGNQEIKTRKRKTGTQEEIDRI